MDNVDLCTTWYKKDEKHILIALMMIGSHTFCSNYSWKVSEKQTELRNAQPSLNTGSVLEGIKKLPGLIVSDIAGMM
jgi:hypothetical protein